MLEDPHPTLTRLLGFLIRDNAQNSQLIDVREGASVLYGLNGAGKSRVMADIQRFQAGLHSPAVALIQLPGRWPNIDWYRESRAADWYPDWAQRVAVDEEDAETILRAWVEMCTYYEDSDLYVHRYPPDRHARLVDEWMEQRLLLVRAIGTEERREWVSAPAFVTRPGATQTNFEAELAEEFARSEDDDVWDEVFVLCLEAVGTMQDGATVCTAAVSGSPIIEPLQWTYSAGRHQSLLQLSPALVALTDDVDTATKEFLKERVETVIEVEGDRVTASDELRRTWHQLERDANQHFSAALLDAPRLRLHVDVAGLDATVEWFVEDDSDLARMVDEDELATWRDRTLGGLSTAQRRWALWSINLALAGVSHQHGEVEQAGEETLPLLVLDEPEAALHRSAEAHMAAYLRRLTLRGEASLLVATHSPELLDLDATRVYEVRRVRGRRVVSELTPPSRDSLSQLGLQPSDLLRRQRGFILVEGHHDALILETLFGPEFQAMRVEVLPLRGATRLTESRIRFLYDYTPAHVIPVLDNIGSEPITELWAQVHEALAGDGLDAALAIIHSAEWLQATEEGKIMRELLQRSLESQLGARITPFGLTAADIIEYLPLEAFVPDGDSWAQLRAEHATAREQRPQKTPRDFKAWLHQQHSAAFDSETLRRATEMLDGIPPDLLRLLKTVEACCAL